MGEITYRVGAHSEQDAYIQFDENDDDYTCLCTFPGNCQGALDANWVRSMALLGAAVVMSHQGEFIDQGGEYVFLPDAVPDWIKREIDRVVGWKGQR